MFAWTPDFKAYLHLFIFLREKPEGHLCNIESLQKPEGLK